MRRALLAPLALVALLLGSLATTTAPASARPARTTAPARAGAQWAGKDPAHNIVPVPAIQVPSSSCWGSPNSHACTKRVLKSLDHAHKVLGKPAYKIPSGFLALTPGQQLRVLTNDDRAAYKLSRVSALNPVLNAAARVGADAGLDPRPVAINGAGVAAFTSNFAEGSGPIENPVFAYYEWMYEDGLNSHNKSHNADCSVSHRSGCWGHRHDVLFKFPKGKLLMGVSSGRFGGFKTWAVLYESVR